MTVAVAERSITERSATELAAAIRTRELSSADVVEAHIERLRRFAWTNAVIADRFDRAREEAAAADARIAAAGDGEELPPLLGVPCTIKESIAVRGMPHSSGVVARREHRAAESAPAAQRLLDAGPILLGVTNISELTMWPESDNRLYGRTRNPYGPSRSAGGSSGGEGAAVGSGGSPLGLGSDIGGSIRTPAFFNGVFGHKPTPGVVPNTGTWPIAVTEQSRRLVAMGPLARRAEDLMPALRLIAGPDGVDDLTRDVALGDPGDVNLKGLPVLLSERSSVLPPGREIRAARERAAAALAAAGAEVKRVEMRSMRRAFELYLTALSESADAGGVRQLLIDSGAEPMTVRSALRRSGPHTLPTRVLTGLESLNGLLPERRTRRLLAAGRSFADELAGQIGVGVLLHPPFPRPAPRHGTILLRPLMLTSMFIFNLAGVPATQVPLGLSRRRLPLGVQVVAGPDRDHVSIAVAIELERALGGWVPPDPLSPRGARASARPPR